MATDTLHRSSLFSTRWDEIPHLSVLLRTTVSASLFQDRLTIPWTLQPVQQDVGCIQNGPLDIDIPSTWNALKNSTSAEARRRRSEGHDIGSLCVLADTPYLAASAAKQAGIPSAVVASFTWSDVLDCFADTQSPEHHTILAAIRRRTVMPTSDYGSRRVCPWLW